VGKHEGTRSFPFSVEKYFLYKKMSGVPNALEQQLWNLLEVLCISFLFHCWSRVHFPACLFVSSCATGLVMK